MLHQIEVTVGKYRYSLSRELNDLDYFVLKFTSILEKLKIKYAVVSGYVAILFGRSRLSEDIDILIQPLPYDRFLKLWEETGEEFWCIITNDARSAYENYLLNGTAVRFALKNKVIPNIEIKFPKTELEIWVIENPIEVNIESFQLRISNIEVQIAFKLYLGSEKDIEDAKHLFLFFYEALDDSLLEKFIKMMGVEDLAGRYLK